MPLNFLAQNTPSSSTRNVDVVQAKEHEVNNEDEVNEPMDVDDNNNIVQDDGTNQMIQELFARKDDDGQDNDGIYDEPLMEKVDKQLYKGSR